METLILCNGYVDDAVVFNFMASFGSRLLELLSSYVCRKCRKHFTFPCVEFQLSVYFSAISNVYQTSFVHIPVLAD